MRSRLSAGSNRFTARRLSGGFAPATVRRMLLAENAVLYSDGSGNVSAALAPIRGAGRVARFFLGIRNKLPGNTRFAPVSVNGRRAW